MKFRLLIALGALTLSGCASQSLSIQDIEQSIDQSPSAFQSEKGGITSSFGDHDVEVTPKEYTVSSIERDAIHWNISGDVNVTGAPYSSSPSFTASASSYYSWSGENQLALSFYQVSDIKLHGITSLHLNGVRTHVKDIIAMRMIENPEFTLSDVKMPKNAYVGANGD